MDPVLQALVARANASGHTSFPVPVEHKAQPRTQQPAERRYIEHLIASLGDSDRHAVLMSIAAIL